MSKNKEANRNNGGCNPENRHFLREKYWEEKLSVRDIAKLCGGSKNTIKEYMDKFRIRRRSLDEACSIRFEQKPYKKRRVLRRLYKKMSVREIAEKFGVDKKVIKYFMDKHGLKRRNGVEGLRLRKESRLSRLCETRFKRTIFEFLRYLLDVFSGKIKK